MKVYGFRLAGYIWEDIQLLIDKGLYLNKAEFVKDALRRAYFEDIALIEKFEAVHSLIGHASVITECKTHLYTVKLPAFFNYIFDQLAYISSNRTSIVAAACQLLLNDYGVYAATDRSFYNENKNKRLMIFRREKHGN